MENLGRWSYDRIKGLKKYKSYFSDKSKNGACQSAETETRTPTAPSTPVQPFPLLRLPREIRDEVYKYFVLIDAPIEFETLRIFRIFPPALDLSIFRVNKQIHDEASGIFYSQNTFPIKLAINRTRSPGSPLYAYGFTVKYIAYWEEFTFHFRTDEPEMVYGPNCRIGQRDKVIAEDDIVLFPAPRYRHLLRRVRIAVLDNRKWRRSKPFDLKTYEDLRALGRTILIPLASRLNTVMADSGENLTVIIEVENRLASKEASVERWLEDETIENWRLAHFKPRRDPKVKMVCGLQKQPVHPLELPTFFTPTDADCYAQLVEMVWPLTTGPWKHILAIPPAFDGSLKGISDRVFMECTQRAEAKGDDNGTSEARVSLIGGSGYWVISKGRLVVADSFRTEEPFESHIYNRVVCCDIGSYYED